MRRYSSQICVILICCVIGLSVITGCVTQNHENLSVKGTIPPDPETGIQNWIDAVNNKNVSRLYELAPAEIKKQVIEPQFKKDNQDNLILKPGLTFETGYTVITKSVNGYNATIKAQLFLKNSKAVNGSPSEIHVQYLFYLFYEDGEWKIWN